MTMILIAAAMMSASLPNSTTSVDRGDWQHVTRAAQRANVPSIDLYRALTEPVEPRRHADETRLCIRNGDIVPGKPGMVCRTRNQWATLGLDVSAGNG